MIRQLFGAALVKAAAFLFLYAANYLLILTLAQADYGRFSFLMAIASIAAMFVSLGYPQILLRSVAAVLANGDHNRIGTIWRIAHLWIIGSSLAFLLMALVSLEVVPERNWAPQLIAASAILPMWALLKLHSAVLHGSHLTTIGQGVETVLRPAIFCIAIVIGVILAADHMSAITVLWLNFAAFSFAFFLAVMANLSCRTYSVLKPSSEAELLPICSFKASFSLAIISASQLVIINTDVVMIGVMMSDEDVAVYRVAMLIALLIGGVNEIVTVVVRPKVATAFASGRLADVVPRVRRLAVFATLATLLFLGVFHLFGKASVARVFGEEYTPVFPLAIILIFSQVVSAYLGPVGMMLNMAHLERPNLVVVVCVIAINLTLNYVLIPLFGLYGAAYASLASICVWRIAGAIQFERHTSIVYLRLGRTKS